METEKLNIDVFNKKITDIFNSISILENSSEKIKKKIVEIKKVFLRFQDNRTLTLKQTNSYLKFQIELLENEKKYYDNMRLIILEKMSKEMLEIHNYTLMILTSLENLEIEHDEEKHNLITKIISHKNHDKINCTNIIQLIDATVNNLNLIFDFLELFDKYIEITTKENIDNNIHCNSFTTTLGNKKNHITLEYKKYCDQLEELIEYFLKLTTSVGNQLQQEEIIKFLVEKK